MYPHLTPFGIIMKINRNPLPEMTEEIVQRDHEFWSQFSDRLIGNWITYDTPVSNICAFAEEVYLRRDYKNFKGDPKFIRDNDGQKAFSKLRSSIAGLYAYRLQYLSKTPAEQQRMLKETEFAFKQSYAFCPYSPEAIFRYVQILSTVGRMDDALLLARTSIKLDPHNPQLNGLVGQLEEIKKQQAALSAGGPPPAPDAGASQRALQAEIARLEAALGPTPTNAQAAYQLAMIYLQSAQPQKAEQLIDRVFAGAGNNIEAVILAAQVYYQLQNFGKAEMALTRYTQLTPDTPEAWFDLAGSQALLKKTNQALDSLRRSLELSDKRHALNSNSPNLKANAMTDPRFTALRPSPQFQKLLTSAK